MHADQQIKTSRESPLTKSLRYAINNCKSQDFNGYRITHTTSKDEQILLDFMKNDSGIKLFIGSKKDIQGFYLDNNLFGLSYSNSTPVNTLKKAKAVSRLFQCIERTHSLITKSKVQ